MTELAELFATFAWLKQKVELHEERKGVGLLCPSASKKNTCSSSYGCLQQLRNSWNTADFKGGVERSSTTATNLSLKPEIQLKGYLDQL